MFLFFSLSESKVQVRVVEILNAVTDSGSPWVLLRTYLVPTLGKLMYRVPKASRQRRDAASTCTPASPRFLTMAFASYLRPNSLRAAEASTLAAA